MGCCGKTSEGRIAISQRDIDNGMAFEIEYTGGRTIQVSGPATGKRYVFSGLQRTQPVDPRDAMAILRDRHFRLKGMVKGQQ